MGSLTPSFSETKVSKATLYVVSLNHLVNDGSTGLISTLFPLVMVLYGFSPLEIGILVAVGYIVNMICQPLTGHYSERYESRKLLAMGIFLMAISMMLFTASSTFPLMLVSVILLRIGSSFFHPVGVSAISRTYSGSQLDRSMGFQSAFGNLGVLLVFLVSAPIYYELGWRAPFLIFAALDLATVVITLSMFGKQKTFTATIDKVQEDVLQTKTNERKNRLGLPIVFIATMLISGGSFAVFSNFGNILLYQSFALTESNALMALWVLSAFFGAMLTGILTRKIERKRFLILSYIVSACSTFGFAFFSSNVLVAITSLLLNGFFLSATYPTIYSELSSFLEDKSSKKGTSFGILFSGQIIGSSIMGFVSGYIAEAISFNLPFGIAGAILLVGCVLALFWSKKSTIQKLTQKAV